MTLPRRKLDREREGAQTPAGFQLKLWSPEQVEKTPPCQAGCPNGNDIRGWVGLIAQHQKMGITREEAYARAWHRLVERNPFPATLGRICPHPCEAHCSRGGREGAVEINALERFLGDWAIEHGLSLQKVVPEPQPESIGVIGAGPAGLSFAYQMARRGYRVTVYEKSARPGGMLMHGIPEYRLPEDIVEAEVQRILDLGVELQLGTCVGRDVALAELRGRHHVLFLGIGAQGAKTLGIPGEEGAGVWSGTAFLDLLNRGERVDLGRRVVVVGGGNTAIDAARAARRLGADVAVLYRRTRSAMPAIAEEVEDAIAERVRIVFLVAPVQIHREGGHLRSVTVQEMSLGEPDGSGRRTPVPVPGATHEIEADSVIVAVSQEPEWMGLDEVRPCGPWIQPDADGQVEAGIWAGGDALGLGIVGQAIFQGRQAAEGVHARLRGLPPQVDGAARPSIAPGSVRTDYYEEKAPASLPRRVPAESEGDLDLEVTQTLSEGAFFEEASRCFSCGLCFGCRQCWTYCNPGSFSRLTEVKPGMYFALNLDGCEGCGKCIEVCPCGYMSASETARAQHTGS